MGRALCVVLLACASVALGALCPNAAECVRSNFNYCCESPSATSAETRLGISQLNVMRACVVGASPFFFAAFRSFGRVNCARAPLASLWKSSQAATDCRLQNNPLLVNHSNWFINATSGYYGTIQSLGTTDYTVAGTPSRLSYTAHNMVGYGLANTILLVDAAGGFVVVDTGSQRAEASSKIAAALAAGIIRTRASPLGSGTCLPVTALIYTHNHIDHTGGAQEWIDRACTPACPVEPAASVGVDAHIVARAECVEVVCQVQVLDAVINTGTRSGSTINARSAFMYGVFVPGNSSRGDGGAINNGIGPPEESGVSTFHPPTKSFTTWSSFRVGSIFMWLRYAPSETEDEIVVFLPDANNSYSLLNIHRHRPDCSDTPPPFVPPSSPAALGRGLLLSAEVIQVCTWVTLHRCVFFDTCALLTGPFVPQPLLAARHHVPQPAHVVPERGPAAPV